MDELDLKVVAAVVEEGRVSDAALKLFVSQPAITYRIRKVERELGVTIFRHSRDGVIITAEGEPVVDYARKMLEERSALTTALRQSQGCVAGTLRIASSFNFAQYMLPDMIERYTTAYPQVKVRLKTGFSHDVVKSLLSEEVDAAISSGGVEWDDLRIHLATENIVLISRQQIRIEELPKYPMIDYSANPNLRKLIRSWWRENFSTEPWIRLEVGYTDTCKEMVQSNIGYAIVPEYCVRGATDLQIHALRWSDGSNLSREINLDCHPLNLLEPAAAKFVELMSSTESD